MVYTSPFTFIPYSFVPLMFDSGIIFPKYFRIVFELFPVSVVNKIDTVSAMMYEQLET